MRRAEVEAKTGFKRAHIYSLMKEGKFPRPCAWVCARSAGIPWKSNNGSLTAATIAPDAASPLTPLNKEKPMKVVSIISTKGGVGKTTTAANLGGFAADAGLRVLCWTWTCSPRCRATSRWPNARRRHLRDAGLNEQRAEQLVSHTAIAGLDLILSNDDRGELNTLLLHAPDGDCGCATCCRRSRRATTCC